MEVDNIIELCDRTIQFKRSLLSPEYFGLDIYFNYWIGPRGGMEG